MQFGVVYPQTEYSNDPSAIKDYAQAAEELGYTHVLAYDHVLGANPDRPGGWNGPYTYRTSFQEPLMLFSFMAGVTQKLGFLPGIIILPQRQTALVAKQAATLDVLCQGRLRFGVGLGWNEVEYEALNENFKNRGKRLEEQLRLLRLLWTEPLVNFRGEWHTIPDAGINPLPIQRPIPIWFGGHAEQMLRRAARLGEGWLPNFRYPADALPVIDKLRRYLQEAGRENSDFGIEARIPYGEGVKTDWETLIIDWQAVGATYISINTMGLGFDTPDAHIRAIRNFSQEIGLKPRNFG